MIEKKGAVEMKKRRILFFLVAALFLTGCTAEEAADDPAGEPQFTIITQEEAKKRMEEPDGHLILDVRRPDEYAQGHIPGAVNLPNEEIGQTPPELLPDFDQVLLLYCRSGRRSKEAARKLVSLGYTQVYEFGGILDWDGALEAETDQAAELRFSSFDGGGPQFTVEIEHPETLSVQSREEYADPAHEAQTGSAFQVIFSFFGRQPGQTRLTVSARSAIAENYDAVYLASVDESLHVSLVEESFEDFNETAQQIRPRPALVVEIAGQQFQTELDDKATVDALIELLNPGALTLTMEDYGSFEKVGVLPETLPTYDNEITTVPGDITLYQGNQLSIYYDENTWSLTRIGKLHVPDPAAFRDLLGDGAVEVTFWLEWDE